MERVRSGVSGSHGFIGRALSMHLEQLGCDIKHLRRDGVVPQSVDVVFDLAAYGNMAGHESRPHPTYKANLMRIARTVEDLRENKLIYVSTSSVDLPHQTFYSASKKAAEEMIQIAVRDYKIKAAIARPYTITGAGEQKDHLIPKLIDSCINQTEMPFVAEPVHDFLDVDDFVNALGIISEKGKFEGEVYKIGTGIQYTNQQVREIVESVTGRKANVRLIESMRAYDTKDWKADNELICSLGWLPIVSLEESVIKQYERITQENH